MEDPRADAAGCAILRIHNAALAARLQKDRLAASRDPDDYAPAIASEGEPHALAADCLERRRVLTHRALLAHPMEICRGFERVALFTWCNAPGSEELFTNQLASDCSSHADAEFRGVF
jgi:hypothetical protein